jgi:hypothetical protein
MFDTVTFVNQDWNPVFFCGMPQAKNTLENVVFLVDGVSCGKVGRTI